MFSAAYEAGKASEVIISWRPVAVVLFPMIAAVVTFLVGRRSTDFSRTLAALSGMITFLLVLSLYPLVQGGVVEYRFTELMRLGLLFRVDLLGFIFAFLISLSWMLVLVYATSYMQIENNAVTYFSFALLTLGGCLGVVLTGDLVSLFLFFELMTFSSFVLVIGQLDREALMAGFFYLYLGIAGGLVLLFGILTLYSSVGTAEIAPLMHIIAENHKVSPAVIFTCFFIGFGIKAGVIPLHLWMPRAYSAAPAVVNALSSGAMIKAGVYGILRILLMVFTPSSLEMRELFSFALSAGYIVMWLGILTMVAGALMALLQVNIMKLLAYSSISQVGYIITGLGAAAYLFGAEEAMGYSGAVLHSFNHTLFKTGFFLITGVIFFRSGELDMSKLGGLWKKMPLLTIFFIIFFLAIAGVPGFNGYISKTLIHDALLEAYKHYGGLDIYIAEKAFLLGSALTLCYYLKFFQEVFLGKEGEASFSRQAPWLLYVPLFVLALFILLIGIYPNFFMDEYILVSAQPFVFEPYSIKHVLGFHFFDHHPLGAALKVMVLAAAIYLPLHKWKLYHVKLPTWLSIEYIIFAPLARLAYWSIIRFGNSLDGSVNNLYLKIGISFLRLCSYVGNFDTNLDRFYERSSRSALYFVEKSKHFDDALNEAYEKTGYTARELADRTSMFDGALNKAYEATGKTVKRMADRTGQLDEALDKTYTRTGQAVKSFADRTGQLDKALDRGYEKAGTSAKKAIYKGIKGEDLPEVEKETTRRDRKVAFNPLEWSIKNINFDQLLMAIMLGLLIFVLFYFARGMVGL